MPFGDSARSLTASSASASPFRSVPQRCRNSCPASVSHCRRVVRSISRTASRSSSALRCRLAAAFDIRNVSAALERLPSSAVLEKTSSCSRRSIFAQIGKETCKIWSLFPRCARQNARNSQDDREIKQMAGPIKHIVMWRLRGETPAERTAARAKVKTLFEGLQGRIDGLPHIEGGAHVSNVGYACDVVLVSEFTDSAALKAYATHPEHL